MIKKLCLLIFILIVLITVVNADIHANIYTSGSAGSNAPYYYLNTGGTNFTNLSVASVIQVQVFTQGYNYYQPNILYRSNGFWSEDGTNKYFGEGSVNYISSGDNYTWTTPMELNYFFDSSWANNATGSYTLKFNPYKDLGPGFSPGPLGYYPTGLATCSTYLEPITKVYLYWKNANSIVYGNTVNSTYGNVTINVKRIGTTTNIQNALVQYTYNQGLNTVTGRTDINGNVSFIWLTNSVVKSPLEVFATGYNYYIEQFASTDSKTFHQIYLSPTGLPNSTNYFQLQIKDATSGVFISDLGISPQNYAIYNYNGSISRNTSTTTSIANIEYGGDSKPLIYADVYNVSAWANGYIKKNITYTHLSSGAIQEIFLLPSGFINQTGSELWVDVIDGSSSSLLSGVNFGIYDYISGEWYNTTLISGQATIAHVGKYLQNNIVLGNNYKLFATASGYGNYYRDITFSKNQQLETLPLSYSNNIISGNFSLSVYAASSPSNIPIQGANIILSNGQSQTTGSNGYAQFILLLGTYQIRGRVSGYSDTTSSITNSDGSPQTINLYFISGSPTATQTPIVTQTIYGWNGSQPNEVSCIQPPYPEGWSFFDGLKNGIACSGVKGQTNQNLWLSLIIIVVLAILLGKYAKGIGVLTGAIIGAAASFGMNLLPLWILVFILLICGIVIAKMLFSGGK